MDPSTPKPGTNGENPPDSKGSAPATHDEVQSTASKFARWKDQTSAWLLDGAMYAGMFALQRRHQLKAGSRESLEQYIEECAPLTREAFFAAPALIPANPQESPSPVKWESPVRTGHPKNDHCHADLYPCARGWEAPTVLFLHALMSTSDTGYRQWAADFNSQGWNACFIHLPYHYSRTPPGRLNGELAITADLVRTAEGLRQGVSELRQLMAFLRLKGCREFGLWASSYGGWIGALLASVESDFRFLALMEPIVDVGHAIWTSPAGTAVRRQLRLQGIDPALVERHFHLTSPLHAMPLCSGQRVVLAAGEYDRVARPAEVAQLHELWQTAGLLRISQGHFGYKMMPAVWRWLLENGVLR